MALPLIWLPLNGSLINNGIDNSGSFSCASAKYHNGKIGKCLNIENYQSNIPVFDTLNGISQFSFSCWLKIDTSKAFSSYANYFKIGFIADGVENYIRIENTSIAGAFQIIFSKSTSGGENNNNYYSVGSSGTLAKNQWCHIAVTNNGTHVRTYFNGSLTSTYAANSIYTSGMLNGKVTLGSSNTSCMLNDVRIYGEALTPKQISLISQGLMLHYPLDNDLASDFVFDCSGYGYDGVFNGPTMSYQNDSKAGNGSIYFTSDHFLKFDNPFWDSSTSLACIYEISIAFWVKLKSTNSYQAIFAPYGAPTTGGVWLSVNTEGSGLWAYQGGNTPYYHKTSALLENDTWFHIVYSFDNGVSRWFLNGQSLGPSVTYTTYSFLRYTNQYLSIGDSYSGTSWDGTPFDGNISDFRIYATALSDSDISDLYKSKISVDTDENLFCYGLNQLPGVKFWDNGIVTCQKFIESEDGSGGQIIEI